MMYVNLQYCGIEKGDLFSLPRVSCVEMLRQQRERQDGFLFKRP